MPAEVIYEQPLSERIRTLLRVESLFTQACHHLEGNSRWDSRAAVGILLDILGLLNRGDIKSELLKELERHLSTLTALDGRPGVDRGKLTEITERIRSLMETLHRSSHQLGHELKDNEFLNAIRQRSTIPGGTCDFDIPAYHYWLLRAPEERRKDLRAWFECLNPAYDAATLILQLTRDSTSPVRRIAHQGLYQETLTASAPHQMIRVGLPQQAPYFAEISAGRHRFTVRFMQQPDWRSRATPVKEDIEFELTCCTL